jgi:hypothetical protein
LINANHMLLSSYYPEKINLIDFLHRGLTCHFTRWGFPILLSLFGLGFILDVQAQ